MVLRKNGPLYLRIGNNNTMISCWAVSETTPVRVSIYDEPDMLVIEIAYFNCIFIKIF